MLERVLHIGHIHNDRSEIDKVIELNDLNIATSLDEALCRTKGGVRKFDAIGPNSLHAVAPNSFHAIGPNSLTSDETEYETDAAATTSIIAILIG